jgi:hypothetical protein
MGVVVYALQFQKSCGDSTPYQCVAGLVGWMQQGLLAPRQDAGDQSKQDSAAAPPPPPKMEPAPVVSAPPPSPKAAPAPAVSGPPPQPVQPGGAGPRSASAPPPPAADSRFTVVNSGSVTLMEFFATRCSVDHWGRDLLGRDVIPAGQRYQFKLDTGGPGSCCYDLRARFQGGQQRTNMGVNVCNVGAWTVGN